MTSNHIIQSENSTINWEIHEFDRIDYGKALELQFELWEDVDRGGNHHLLLLEHNPVITLGRRTEESHLLWSKDQLDKEGIETFKVERGGSATYHGPGQLVGYVICKTSRYGGIHELVTKLLTIIQKSITELGIDSRIDDENPGIWTVSDIPRKLAAVGMRNKKGISLHGFAINIDMPLTGFSAIVPCGLTLPVSTLSIELGENMPVGQVKDIILANFIDEFT